MRLELRHERAQLVNLRRIHPLPLCVHLPVRFVEVRFERRLQVELRVEKLLVKEHLAPAQAELLLRHLAQRDRRQGVVLFERFKIIIYEGQVKLLAGFAQM